MTRQTQVKNQCRAIKGEPSQTKTAFGHFSELWILKKASKMEKLAPIDP
jgi:hypothetical protein